MDERTVRALLDELTKIAKSQSPQHGNMVRSVAQGLQHQGNYVLADIEGWSQPPSLDGCRPDVYAKTPKGDEIIVEVETLESERAAHSGLQREVFKAWVHKNPSTRALLEVVVDEQGNYVRHEITADEARLQKKS